MFNYCAIKKRINIYIFYLVFNILLLNYLFLFSTHHFEFFFSFLDTFVNY